MDYSSRLWINSDSTIPNSENRQWFHYSKFWKPWRLSCGDLIKTDSSMKNIRWIWVSNIEILSFLEIMLLLHCEGTELPDFTTIAGGPSTLW